MQHTTTHNTEFRKTTHLIDLSYTTGDNEELPGSTSTSRLGGTDNDYAPWNMPDNDEGTLNAIDELVEPRSSRGKVGDSLHGSCMYIYIY